MGSFLIGCAVGGVIGTILVIVVVAKDPAEPYATLNRKRAQVRTMAVEQERKSKEICDALGQAKAEGLWEAVKTLYED